MSDSSILLSKLFGESLFMTPRHHNNRGLKQVREGWTKADCERWHLLYTSKEVNTLDDLQRIEKAHEYNEGVSEDDINSLIVMARDKDDEIEILARDLHEMRLRAECAERRRDELEDNLDAEIKRREAEVYNDSH